MRWADDGHCRFLSRLKVRSARGQEAGMGLAVVTPILPLVAGSSEDISVLPLFGRGTGAGFGGGGANGALVSFS